MKFLKHGCQIINIKEIKTIISLENRITFYFYTTGDFKFEHKNREVISRFKRGFEDFLRCEDEILFDLEYYFHWINLDYGENA